MPNLALTSLLTLLFAAEATAAPNLLNYENRVVRAAEQIERIKADKEYSEEGITYIKRLLPRSEQIEFDGSEVSVDNTWLYALLESYAAERDPQQRVARLNEASGMLRALDEHLRHVQAGESNDHGGAQDKIREILSRSPYQPERETAIGAFVKRVLRTVRGFMSDVYSALTRLLEKLFGAGAQGGWISNLLIVALLAAALVVAARMARRLRVPRTKRKKTRLILGEEIGADGTSRELADAGLAAARAGDFRTAVRKLYVSLLYELGERNLIELDDSATNREYLSEVSRFTALAAAMRHLTDRFDQVWYGMFPSSEEDFAAYLAHYDEAMERARTLSQQAASAS